MHPSQKTYQTSLFINSNNAVELGVVAATNVERRRFWQCWTTFLDSNYTSIQHDLSNINRQQQIALLGAFAHHVRSGHHTRTQYDRPRPTSAQRVTVALRAVSQTIILDGGTSPVETAKGTYPLQLQRIISAYTRDDPAPKPKLALPFSAIQHIHDLSCLTTDPKYSAISDLCIIAWYFLLRVGEYTHANRSAARRTTQFRIHDVTLWESERVLSHALPRQYLLDHCTSATLRLDNQKNGKRNAVIHHHTTGHLVCPVKALIRRVAHIRCFSTDPATMLGKYFSATRPLGWHVTSSDINKLLKSTVISLGLARYNIHPDDISSHSLRAGGAMALHLNKVDTRTIQLMGRWSSDTFLLYIHQQISAFSQDLSTLMSNNINYHNIHIQPSVNATSA